MNLTLAFPLNYACGVAGIPAAEFNSSMTEDGRKPIFSGVAFFVSQAQVVIKQWWATQLVGRVLRGFMPAAFFCRGLLTWHPARLFLFNSGNSEYIYDRRGAAMSAHTQAESAQKIFLPFTYEDLKGIKTPLPLYNYQRLCLALEIIDHRLADDEPGCIDTSIDPELGLVHEALMIAVLCHPQWQNKTSICNRIQTFVHDRFQSFNRGGNHE